MISICIPIYNFDVRELVETLSKQSDILKAPTEIILIDDCSDYNFKEINEESCSKYNYIKLEKNIGRAAIRNKFLDYASYGYLLYLDCDSVINRDDFLENYLSEIQKFSSAVVCGGRVYSNIKPNRNKMLRWVYGTKRESQPYHVRKLHPNKSFMTNNFIVKRNVFEMVKFDEKLSGYGHEDTLFGYELKKNKIIVSHIDNPILNGDIESNNEYLKKTNEGMANLASIFSFYGHNQDLINTIKLLGLYFNIKKFKRIISLTFFLFKPFVLFLLTKGYVNLYLFDYYKLGLLVENIQRRECSETKYVF